MSSPQSILIIFLIYSLILGGIIASSSQSYAQSPPEQAIQQNLPGQIEQRFEERILPRSTDKQILPDITTPSSDGDEADSVRFMLNGIRFVGNTLYSNDELLLLSKKLIGNEVSLKDMFTLADAITVQYRNDGYVLSQAFLPPQTVEDGVVIIQIVEGFIDKIVYQDEALKGKETVEDYAKGIKGGVLKAADLEKFILLINDLPGIMAQIVLKPSDTVFGAADLVMIIDKTPQKAIISADNRGSRYVGPFQISGDLYLNSAVQDFDQIRFHHTSTTQRRELNYYQLAYTMPVGANGGTVSFQGTRSFVDPGYTLNAFDVESESAGFSVIYKYPFIRSREENLFFNTSLNYRNSKSNVLGSLQSEDRLRTLKIGASYDFIDSLDGINLAGLNLAQGLPVMNASESGDAFLSRTYGRGDFTKLTFDALRLQRISDRVSAFLSASGQYSFSQLLSSEEFGYGGAQFGRAYDPSEITGDHGLSVSAELRYTMPDFNFESISMIELYGFYDIGAVWRIEPNGDPDGAKKSGSSLGLGTRIKLSNDLSTSFEAAKPLTRPVESRSQSDTEKGDDVRFFFSLSKLF